MYNYPQVNIAVSGVYVNIAWIYKIVIFMNWLNLSDKPNLQSNTS